MGDKNPFKKGTSYELLYRDFFDSPAVTAFTPSEQIVVLLFMMKWGRRTEGGKLPKQIPFSPLDVRLHRISESTFRRMMLKGEGVFWRKVSNGGGRSKNHYEPIPEWETYPIHGEHPPYSQRIRPPIQGEYGLGVRNESCNEEAVMEPKEDISILEDHNNKTAEIEGATEAELSESIIAVFEPGTNPKTSPERSVLLDVIREHGIERVKVVAKQAIKNPIEPIAPFNVIYKTLGYS